MGVLVEYQLMGNIDKRKEIKMHIICTMLLIVCWSEGN